MRDQFKLTPEVAEAAMRRIASSLTDSQQKALVKAIRRIGAKRGPVPVQANEQTMGSFLRGEEPLVYEAGRQRFLTPLGRSLGIFLADLPKYNEVPDINKIIPSLPEPEPDA